MESPFDVTPPPWPSVLPFAPIVVVDKFNLSDVVCPSLFLNWVASAPEIEITSFSSKRMMCDSRVGGIVWDCFTLREVGDVFKLKLLNGESFELLVVLLLLDFVPRRPRLLLLVSEALLLFLVLLDDVGERERFFDEVDEEETVLLLFVFPLVFPFVVFPESLSFVFGLGLRFDITRTGTVKFPAISE